MAPAEQRGSERQPAKVTHAILDVREGRGALAHSAENRHRLRKQRGESRGVVGWARVSHPLHLDHPRRGIDTRPACRERTGKVKEGRRLNVIDPVDQTNAVGRLQVNCKRPRRAGTYIELVDGANGEVVCRTIREQHAQWQSASLPQLAGECNHERNV
eukprot:scaffold9160_cov73-Phaeocystis_antarctica.AAC.6